MHASKYWVALWLCLVPLIAWSASPLDGMWEVVPGSYQTNVRLSFSVKDGVYTCRSGCGASDSVRYRIPADGQFHALSHGHNHVSLAVQVLNAHALRILSKKNGTVFRKVTFFLDPDGESADVHITVHRGGREFSMHSHLARIKAGPAHSHALSGVWRLQTAMGSTRWSYTIRTRNGVLSFKDSTGPNYHATIGGSPSEVHDDIPNETVSVRRLPPRTWQETFRQHGKKLGTRTLTINKSGDRVDVVEAKPGTKVIQRWTMVRTTRE